ncbi:hypothetical protein J6590_030468 [Homalodisca vitripennis]|nr:hypothetical protein J6590_030468 [Homalodisca vitripennis]
MMTVPYQPPISSVFLPSHITTVASLLSCVSWNTFGRDYFPRREQRTASIVRSPAEISRTIVYQQRSAGQSSISRDQQDNCLSTDISRTIVYLQILAGPLFIKEDLQDHCLSNKICRTIVYQQRLGGQCLSADVGKTIVYQQRLAGQSSTSRD